MKRIITFTALCLLVIMSAFGVYAETDGEMEIFHNHSNSASSTVVYGIDEAYTVTIPPDVELDLEEPQTETVSLTGVYMPLAKSLSMTVESSNYNDTKSLWQVVLDTDSDVKIPYSIKKGGNAVASEAVILTCDGGTNEVSADLVFTVEEPPVQSGTYLDTLTFTVSINVIEVN